MAEKETKHLEVEVYGYDVTVSHYPLLDDDILFSQAPADTRHLLVTRRDVDAATGLAEYRFDIALDGAVT